MLSERVKKEEVSFSFQNNLMLLWSVEDQEEVVVVIVIDPPHCPGMTYKECVSAITKVARGKRGLE